MGKTALKEQLFYAVVQKDVSKLNKLILDKADLNAKVSSDGNTPLILAVYVGSLEISKLLIKAGADIEIGNNDGVTPLMQSVKVDSPEITKFLIDAGAKTDVKDKDGRTPLMWVLGRNCAKITKILLDAGAKE